jgi:N-methylhydantoinase A
MESTVTDANVMLGFTNPTGLARGTLPIAPELAKIAVQRSLADPLGTDVLSASWGMFTVANATMTRALRAVSTERGYDSRLCDLVAFGGAGPVHAVALAESLGIRRVFIPMLAGVFSALGLLLAEVRHDFVIGVGGRLDDLAPDVILRAFDEAAVTARSALKESCGGPPPDAKIECFAGIRYAYQISAIVVRLDQDVPAGDLVTHLRQRFTDAHVREFGFSRDDAAPVEVENLRLTITSVGMGGDFASVGRAIPSQDDAAHPILRTVSFGPSSGAFETMVISRRHLTKAPSPLAGPLLIEEDDTTIVVPPGWTARCDEPDRIVMLEQAQ